MKSAKTSLQKINQSEHLLQKRILRVTGLIYFDWIFTIENQIPSCCVMSFRGFDMSLELSGNIWKVINRWICVHLILYLSLKFSGCTRHCLLSKQLSETIMITQPKYWDGAKLGLILLLITINFFQFAKIMIFFFRIKLKLYMIQWNVWESNSNIYDIQCHYKKNWILFSFVCYYYLYVINTFVKQ